MQQHTTGLNGKVNTKKSQNSVQLPAKFSKRDVGNIKDLKPQDEDDQYHKKFKLSIMDQDKDYPLPLPVIGIYQYGALLPFLSLKSFSLWQGKQKSKKTTALALAVAAFIKGDNNSEATGFVGKLDGKVLFFDTEQGTGYAARTMQLILALAGVRLTNKLVYCDLREFSAADRRGIVEAGIKYSTGVKLVVIDGLVDLLEDFMDAGEGHLTVTEILKLCSRYDIHVAGVLHQNKNDTNARAHVGSIASQKCEIEISTEKDPKDNAQSIVRCINSRGLSFEPFAIRWDKDSLPRISQEWSGVGKSAISTNKNIEKTKEVVQSVFKSLTALSHTKTIEGIMSNTLRSQSTAKRMLTEMLAWNLIKKGDDGTYQATL